MTDQNKRDIEHILFKWGIASDHLDECREELERYLADTGFIHPLVVR